MYLTARQFPRLLLAALFLLGALAPLAGAQTPPGGSLKVVATTSIIADWLSNVGAGHVQITTLVGPDGDPHDYQPVPADSLALAKADLIFENGLGLEQWLDKLYATSGSHAARVVVSRDIAPREVREAGSDGPQRELDPHMWQDVEAAGVMVDTIEQALIKADPPHAADYAAAGLRYHQQLHELNKWVQKQIDSIPLNRRKLVTTHDAFGYFGRRYGMDVSRSALESVTTEASDPSAQQIAQVVDQIRASGVPVIFLENIQNPKLIEQIAAEAHVKVGPPLYSDALGPPGSAGDTYIKMIRYNVKTLVAALK